MNEERVEELEKQVELSREVILGLERRERRPIHLAIKDLWPGGYPKYRWFRVCRPDDLCWVSDSMPVFLTEDPDKATCKRCYRITAYKMAKELK